VLRMELEGEGVSVLSLLVCIKNGDDLGAFGVGWLSGEEVVRVVDRRDDFKR
jgi:hypothetical protein